MRKADYAALARIIAHEREYAARIVARPGATLQDRHYASAILTSTERIARAFALGASVNRSEFLRACGIDPGAIN